MDSNCIDEAVKDQGAFNRHLEYSDRDIEGHKANTYEAGLLNGNGSQHSRHGHRRHRHHHRHHHHKGEGEEERPVTPPSQRVRFILGEGLEDDDSHPSHPVFSEMEELVVDSNGELEWRETARWVKFEENVEEGGNRWSKPHVATLSLHSLFELRSIILNGTVMLDCDAFSLEQLVDLILDNLRNNGNLSEEYRDKLKDILLRRHRHQHEKRHDSNKGSKLTLIRSLADIGRVHSSSKSNSSNNHAELGLTTSPSGTSLSRNHSGGHLTVGEGMTGSPSTNEMQQLKGNLHFLKKLPPGTEASNILVGELECLEHTISAFVRLTQASVLGDLTEVNIPTRFVFIMLGPQGNISRYHEIGRAVATLMSDEVFHEVAYKGRNRTDLIAAVDEFLDAVTVLPPGEWDPSIRIEPPNKIPSQEHRKVAPDQMAEEIDEELEEERERAASGLRRSGRLFGGLMNDIKRKVPFYLSDFKDAFALQCVASFIFLYFACLTPIITFGGLLGQATGDRIAAIESLVSGCLCGLLYGLFSGQPLTILSSTGPVLVFETISYSFCSENGLDYLSFRLWIGMWTGLILILLVAFDASAFVMYITRFTEENFACLISLIFIYKAFENMWDILHEYPVNTHFDSATGIPPITCNCTEPSNYTGLSMNWSSFDSVKCTDFNGTLIGDACEGHPYYPDVFLMSMMLFLLTFLLSMGLKEIKTSSFFPAKVREVMNDFAVTIAIMSMVFLDWYIGLETPKLLVPAEFKPTWSGRGWFIHPFGKNPWWTSIAAIIPALLATILIFMDQQITAVIVNRKEHKLKKGGGYHLDLFVLSILIIVNSLLGLPWFVAGTVLAVNHVNSLRMESETAAPGEKPQFLGVREQRVTHLLIFILIGFSVLLTPVLQVIPMPVLYGVFLYMGASSLQGLQFIQRILIVFMPAKYQPDYMFLRQVPLMRVHLFTLVQVVCLLSLWVVKSYKSTSIAFPLMLVVLIVVRKALDFVFTQRELKILDDVMPESAKKKKEEEKRRKSEVSDDVDDLGVNGESNGKGKHNFLLVANGSLVKGSSEKFEKLNMSEEVAKSGIWRQVNDNSSEELTNHKSKSKNKRGNKKDVMNDEEYKRLSTMAEEDDEDGPISIRIESPSINDLNKTKSSSKSKDKKAADSIPTNHNETSV